MSYDKLFVRQANNVDLICTMTHYCDVIVFSSLSDRSIEQLFNYFLRYMKIKKLINDMNQHETNNLGFFMDTNLL